MCFFARILLAVCIWSYLSYHLIVVSGGGGGKGTWGKLSDEMDADSHTKDYRDPNYDSADEVPIS